MIALPLALSLSNSVTEIGALAAFAALLGIAILSLLVFSQAREIKRLREWAGRAPERASELEQRVSAEAAARAQRPEGPPAPVRVVPRKTPLVSAPVSTAVNATVAAAIPGAGAVAPVPTPATAAAGAPAAPAPPGAEGVQIAATAAADATAAVGGGSATAVEETPASGEPPRDGAPLDSAEETSASTPATAAARAAAAPPRAPLPPSPAAPAPPGVSASPVASGATPVTQPPKPASRPPGPVAATRRSVPSRAVAGSGLPASARTSSSPPKSSAGAATAAGARASAARAAGRPADSGGPTYFKPERSPRRTMLIAGAAVVVVVVLLVLGVSALKGGGSTPTAAKTTQGVPTGEARTSGSHTTVHATAGNPAETTVVVLNGTSTPDLAHHLAADLQQSGYTRAAASAAVPPGTHATTTVQYAHGHRADAEAVAKALNVTQVQAMEGTTAALASSATIVVLAGADQATQLGGGGAQSKGEPAVGSTGAGGEAGVAGEGAAGSGN